MKKEPKVEYGIQIVKPWSTEMYRHNEWVADIVKAKVLNLWDAALDAAEIEFESEDELGNEFADMPWDGASSEMVKIQTAITCYGFGFGHDIGDVSAQVEDALENAPLYHLKEIAEELGLVLEKGFVGFN
jgi:hypothetical protein